MFEVIVEKEGLEFLGWREVPVSPKVLGHKALECMPCIMQAFVKRPEDVERGLDFDRMLYVARRVFEQSNDDTYVVSFSSRTIVYKGMFWWDSFVCSLKICKARNINLRLQLFIPVLVRTQTQVG